MIPWKMLGRTEVPDSGGEMTLFRRGEEYSIRVEGLELMNSRMHGSEEVLAEVACAKVRDRERPRVLIGGLGMGFTLAEALARLGDTADVVVAELVPAVVAWNREHLGALAGHPLKDPRTEVREMDVARILKEAPKAWDAILLDVDNGPDGFTRVENDWLYGMAGLKATLRALRPGGYVSVWSAAPDREFTRRMKKAGFAVEELRVRARDAGKGSRHTIWLGRRPE